MTTTIYIVLCLSFLNFVLCEHDSITPIVLWHGMGESSCFPFVTGILIENLNASLPGAHIVSIRIGNNIEEDVKNSFFKHPDEQIQEACAAIAADPLLQNGFNAIGLSQGAQFMRGLVQRCPQAKVKNLISLAGQHQGVYGIFHCGPLTEKMCDFIRRSLNHAAYKPEIQKMIVQATFWHDPLNEQIYRDHSTFLSDINNEKVLNTEYIHNLQAVENFVMVKFENDSMIVPLETEWFGFYKPGQSVETESLQESDLYIDDRLGLQKMDKQSKLHFLSVEGDHLMFEWTWFEENILKPFLKS
ncbi:palmitoyl-protein thioesterase 1 [Leptinotarsa decemlineata]|uniref:palmitoyl-protein thioesterase 1 n=1 Tax=Leptinotarsa decemlineata TaxID=7539 RepID=UPI003D30C2E9